MIQRTEEWYKARLGKVTASKIDDVMSVLKSGGEPAGRRNYRTQLVVELLTGQVQESYTNAAMQWGIDCEDQARMAYTFATGNAVEEVGFIDHPGVEMSGCSPDGLVGTDGMIEIKCPNTSTMLDYIMTGGVPSDYVKQMQWQMAVTGRSWNDFVAFDPRLPEHLQLFVCRLHRDDDMISKVESAVRDFRREIVRMIERLEERK